MTVFFIIPIRLMRIFGVGALAIFAFIYGYGAVSWHGLLG
jgi:hypothetical protein